MSNETKPTSFAEPLFGCIIILAPLLWLGSCVFGGSDKPTPAPTETPTTTAVSTTQSGPAIGSNILEQAIFDAFPTSPPKTAAERKNARNAADYVGATINAAGHLCVRPIEAQQAASGQYGIGCVKYRGGGGTANYLIDVRTGSVDEI